MQISKPQSEQSREKRTIPAKACQSTAGACEFAEPPEDDRTVPVRIVARSGKPITHWYWGRIVHDLAGMHLHKPRLPIDYLHDPERMIGFLDQFDKGKNGQLEVSGALVPFGERDIATEIIYRAKNGVPYEASIDWGGDGIKLEELDAGAKAKVNGYEVEGPITIVREWPLRGVAVCPYGADMNTKTEFSGDENISVTLIPSGEDTMDAAKDEQAQSGLVQKLALGFASLIGLGEKPPAAADEKTPEGPAAAAQLGQAADPPAAKDPKAEVKAELKRFRDAFGPAGVDRFLEGKTFQEAEALQAAEAAGERSKDLKKLEAEKQDLEKRLAAVDRGEDEAADFQADATDDPQAKVIKQFTPVLGENLARLAAGMKRK